ncbi:hypothetical protein GCM10020331_086350 [Ectobacillus funiculus]
MYYDSRLGDVTYEVGDEVVTGNVSLKRQYIIEDGELEEIRDIDITTHDELLQQALSGSAQNRLTDIVSTIQDEQNRVIRADLYKPLIVQGVAGSGKNNDCPAPNCLFYLQACRLFLSTVHHDFGSE